MKKRFFLIAMLLVTTVTFSQIFTTNTNPVGMEHNVLFNATTRYQVTQTGGAPLNLDYLFDGKFVPSYTTVAPTSSSPTVILIENLPNWHTQRGAWVGWSTRYWQSKRFKIEGYDIYNGNVWKTIADYSGQDYSSTKTDFAIKIPSGGSYTKLRFTFYSAYGTDGRLGVSELFFLHPETVSPYEGLFGEADDIWSKNNDYGYTTKRIGIGTSSPSGILEVKNGAYKTYFTGNALTFKNNDATSYIDKRDGGSLRFRMGTNYSTAMILTNDLKVGIGTTAPESNLQIGGSTTNGLVMLGGGKGYSSIGSTRSDGGLILGKNVYARYQDATDNLVGRVGKSTSTGFSGIKLGQNGVIDFFGKNGGVTAESIANTTETSRMRIDNNGRVGIGTTNTFGYRLAVNGNIGAKEIKVETNSAWPDFVFEKDYDLPTLTEVENHIKEKGHLKNIPSAEKVKKDGFFLGAMDAKLLQKIEELTLYTIQQEKQLKKQTKDIEELKELVEKLIKSKNK